MVIDGSVLFLLILLVMFFLVGAGCLLVGVVLLVRMIIQHFRFKRDEGRELREEQQRAVAVAEAIVIQHFYDNGSGQGACI